MNVGKDWRAPGNVTFHKIGLAGTNHVTNTKWTMKTLESIMKELGHENVGGVFWSGVYKNFLCLRLI